MKKLIRKIGLVQLFLMFAFASNAQNENQNSESLKLHHSIYFDWNNIYAQGAQLEALNEIGQWLSSNDMNVILVGSSDSQYTTEGGSKVAEQRAKSVAQWLQTYYNIPSSRIEIRNGGIDETSSADKARRVDVMELIAAGNDISGAQTPMEDMTVSEEVAEIPETAENSSNVGNNDTYQPTTDVAVSEDVEEIYEDKSRAKTNQFSIRTNLLYNIGGLFNLGVEYQHGRMGYLVNGGYSPFESSKWDKNWGGWFVAPEVRYYLGKRERGFLGAQFLTGGYNMRVSDFRREGHVLCGGLTGGYKININDLLDMDFSLGLGYSSLKYDKYTVSDELLVKDVRKKSITPIQAGISLIFKL